MKMGSRYLYSILVLLVFLIAVVPAQAFTINSLDVEVDSNGDAVASLSYELTWLEYFGYFLGIGDLKGSAQGVLNSYLPYNSNIAIIDNQHAVVAIDDIASVSRVDNQVTYNVNEIKFSDVDRDVQNNWISGITTFDLSPANTRIIFPDRHVISYSNLLDIPVSVYTVNQ